MDRWVVQQVKSFSNHGLAGGLSTFADSLFSQMARVANIKVVLSHLLSPL